jgi:glutamine cyclotransferase
MALGAVGLLVAAGPLPAPRAQAVPAPQTFEVVRSYPHDRRAWTQGLFFEDGRLFEGTGKRGHSTLREVDLESGKVLRSTELGDNLFGEGAAPWQDRIIQLTWRAGIGLVYDRDSFERLATFRYPTEGWGITHDGTHLVMGDGSAILRFWDPETFREVRRIEVHAEGRPVTRLNELEYINGEIYANVWQTNLIARINPADGRVVGWVDLAGLLSGEDREGADVLNGIAYDAAGDRLFVTGKHWPKLFEIKLVGPRSG